ncbi:polysaccharide deacetylase, partial [mine drainage metagenome]
VTVGVGSTGQIALYNHAGTVNVDVDVDGYYTGSSGGTGALFVPITPVRLTDTRAPMNGTPIGSDSSETFSLSSASIPSNASAVAANLTVVAGDAPGYLTAYPIADATVPVASDLNWMANEIVPNFTIADTAGTGRVAVFNSLGATSNLLIDASGYFTATTNPTVSGVSPTVGPTVGGTSATITGTNFTGATVVDFGGAAATSFTVASSTSITATSPAGSPGTVNVTVTT